MFSNTKLCSPIQSKTLDELVMNQVQGRFHGEKIPKSETEKAETICIEVTRYYIEKVVHVIHLLSSKLLEN